MKRSLLAAGSAVALLAGVAGAGAAPATTNPASATAVDAGPVIQNSRAMAAADDMPKVTVRQQLMDQLTKAGFTDITMVPSAFYIHAKNKAGDPVAMVIGPDGFTEVTEVPTKPAGAAGAQPVQPGTAATTAPKQ